MNGIVNENHRLPFGRAIEGQNSKIILSGRKRGDTEGEISEAQEPVIYLTYLK
jgi:hypothetical protein